VFFKGKYDNPDQSFLNLLILIMLDGGGGDESSTANEHFF